MNASKALVRCFSRAATNNAAKKEVAPGYAQIREKYKAFQIDNNLLVHQRGGPTDQIFFAVTVLVNGIGLIMVADVFYRMAFNKK